MPSTSISFMEALAPVTMRTEEDGTPVIRARKRTMASLALPSTGGAATLSFHASPNRPVNAVSVAPGLTLS